MKVLGWSDRAVDRGPVAVRLKKGCCPVFGARLLVPTDAAHGWTPFRAGTHRHHTGEERLSGFPQVRARAADTPLDQILGRVLGNGERLRKANTVAGRAATLPAAVITYGGDRQSVGHTEW